MSRLASVALIVLASAPGSAQVFRTSTDVVSVNVTVRAGRSPVRGLTSADFELLDNGVRQTIDAISIEEIPIDLTLVLDTSGSTAAVIDRFKAGAHGLSAMLRPRDRVRLISVSTMVVEIFGLTPAGLPLPVEGLQARGTTSLHDALLLSLARPSPEGRRQLVIAFTDGFDTTSILPGQGLVAAASRSDAALHIVLAGGVGLPPTMRSLRAAAEVSGGELYTRAEFADVTEAFRSVFDDFRQSYVLQYTLAGVDRRGWHDLTVNLTKALGRRYTLRSRRGYFGG